ncbi:MAG TPA: ParB/RepB/Spo0J family partition protein [Isosphaeraceae bacterium]|nr:ParB/RepB/Spo0J family partition protein [Isosphaeraceae bacterium]
MDLKSRLEANVANLHRERPASPAPAQGERAGRRRDLNLFALSLDRLRADETQVRKENKLETDPEVIELAESIQDVGLLEPINVRYLPEGDFYQVVAGERRYVAARLAGLTEVPVKLLDLEPSQVKRLQLIENIHRADLTPLELSEALHSLLADGSTVDDLSKLLHKSKPYVQKALKIGRDLAPEVKEQAEGLSMDHLYEVSQVPADQQEAVVRFVQENNVSTKELRELVADKKPRGGAGRPASVKAFRRVVTCPNGISITFASQNATEGNVALLEALVFARKTLQKEAKSDAA